MSRPSAVEPPADVGADPEEEPGQLARHAETDALAELAPGLSLAAAGNLIALLAARRRLEPA
jgi:hypothetical protein